MLVDLSIPINAETPVYPGDSLLNIEPAGVLTKDGFQDYKLSFGNHLGTHVDAPFHMFAGGKNLDQIPLEQFAGKGVCIAVEAEYDLEMIRAVAIEAGDIVLFYTGTSDKRLHEPDYYQKHPVVPMEVAEHLIEQRVKMVGVDTGGIDHDLSIHKILLKNKILILENLTNLGQLAGKQFKIYAFPIRFQLDGAPVRVVAEVAD